MDQLITVLPYVISGIICVGVWVGVMSDTRIRGWVICLIGHASFVLYGALTDQHGFLIIPPFTAIGLAVGITKELERLQRQRRTINSKPDTIDIEG